MDARPNIVLVHGAWADGSCWSGVIEQLQADGYHVTAPQFPLTSLADDVARLRHVLELQDGTTIVVGHSYGGQIVTALGTDAPTSRWSPTLTRSHSSFAPLRKEFAVPMIDVYAAAGTFGDRHQLAVDLATAVMTIEQVPDIPMFRRNKAAFVHELPADSLSNVDGDSTYVRVQVLTNAGALDRDKQLAVVEQLTQIVATGARRPQPRRPDLGPAHRSGAGRLGTGRTRQHQRRGTRPHRPRPDRRPPVPPVTGIDQLTGLPRS